MTTGPTMYLLPMVENEPSFNSAKDFVPVSQLARFEFVVAVSPSIGVTDFKQLVAWIKANPSKASYGVPSSGTIPHFTGWQLEKALGLSMTRVPYRGSAPIINDLIGGHLPFGVTTLVGHHHPASRRRHPHRGGERPDALAVPAGCADPEGGRRRSGGRRLVRHVAAGGLARRSLRKS